MGADANDGAGEKVLRGRCLCAKWLLGSDLRRGWCT